MSDAIDRYHEILTSYVDRGGEDHHALVDRFAEIGAAFPGRPACRSLRPHFMLRAQYDLLLDAIRHFRAAVLTAHSAILADPSMLEQMALTDGERRLLVLDHELRSFGTIARVTAALTGDALSLVSLDAERAFSHDYADRLTELFEGFQPVRQFLGERAITPIHSGSAWVGAVLDAWHEHGRLRPPRVAIVDWREVAARAERDMLCERFRRHGVCARFADPRELEFIDGGLSAGGEGIDLVYRRALTGDLLAREDEVLALFEAYRTGAVCVVNGFGATLLDKNMLFAMLHDDRVRRLYTAEQAAAIERFVPWTRPVAEGKTTGPDGSGIDLLPYCLAHKNELTIKPNDEVGGRGAVIGENVEPGVWDRALRLATHDPSVVQLRALLPSAMFAEVGAAGELYFSRRFIETDAQLLRGQTRGLTTRLSAALGSVQTETGAVPTFILDDV